MKTFHPQRFGTDKKECKLNINVAEPEVYSTHSSDHFENKQNVKDEDELEGPTSNTQLQSLQRSSAELKT